jgi:hypothetical protein
MSGNSFKMKRAGHQMTQAWSWVDNYWSWLRDSVGLLSQPSFIFWNVLRTLRKKMPHSVALKESRWAKSSVLLQKPGLPPGCVTYKTHDPKYTTLPAVPPPVYLRGDSAQYSQVEIRRQPVCANVPCCNVPCWGLWAGGGSLQSHGTALKHTGDRYLWPALLLPTPV